MVRSYFRHGPTEVRLLILPPTNSNITFQAFGLVCSASSNSVFDGKLAYVPALEDVLVWDVKRGNMVCDLDRTSMLNSRNLMNYPDCYVAREWTSCRSHMYPALPETRHFRGRIF